MQLKHLRIVIFFGIINHIKPIFLKLLQ